MAKYSDAFKLKLVTEYLNGNLGYRLLAKQYDIPDPTPIKRWVMAYKAQGVTGITRKAVKTVYPVQFKLDTIQFILETGASYPETAVQFNLNNPALILHWMKTFQKDGVEGLKPKPKGRPSMAGKPKKQKQEEAKQLTREEALERENELLRLENAYLKKLKAFRKKNASHEKHRQNWHSNSKGKDSD
ncbi:helix-turn-helix domain-containing protein [Salinicoccus sp. HZC-1]|uniref:helix-turn-helix domain-containing protein n=1 Tax=Salinicoccus sp. HZC-1 TaxID=3385497 RepID=UPI00398BB01F